MDDKCCCFSILYKSKEINQMEVDNLQKVSESLNHFAFFFYYCDWAKMRRVN